MRLAVFSDIHGNSEALARGIEHAGAVEEFLVAGDLVYEYRFSNETIEVVRQAGMHAVLDNHDVAFLGPAGARARTRPDVRPENVAYLASLPLRLDLTLGGRRLCMVHASPWPPYTDYLHRGHPLLHRSDELGVDVLVFGHTHTPMVERQGKTLVVNPGTLGEPIPGEGDVVAYAVVDTEALEAEIVRLPHPRALSDARVAKPDRERAS